MSPVSVWSAGAVRVTVLSAAVALAGCEGVPLQSNATNVGSTGPLPAMSAFRYAMVSPASSNDAENWAEAELVRHGYTVFPSYAAAAVLRASPPPPILMVECYDLGSTFIVVGTTRRVRCIGVNMRTGERLYDGNGEGIGRTVTDDFQGAVRAALARLPRSSQTGGGRALTLGEVPNALVAAYREGIGPPRAAGPAPATPTVVRESSGTGFVVSTAGHVLTNAHVVDDCRRISGKVGPATHTLTLQVRDEENDLAILVLPGSTYAPVRLRQSASARLGEPVTVIGFPLSGVLASSLNVTTGNVSSLSGLRNNISRFQITAPIQPGNSGGPVVDERGALVGVVVSSLDERRAVQDGFVPQNVNFAIKGSVAALFLDTHNVRWQPADSGGTPRSTAAIAEEAAGYTVAISCTS